MRDEVAVSGGRSGQLLVVQPVDGFACLFDGIAASLRTTSSSASSHPRADAQRTRSNRRGDWDRAATQRTQALQGQARSRRIAPEGPGVGLVEVAAGLRIRLALLGLRSARI